MRLRLIVVPTAERHIRTASGWWQDNRATALDLFGDELAKAFDLVTSFPTVAPMVSGREPEGIRRFLLSGTGHHLYYRVRGEAVEVLAFWHSSRGDGPPL